MPAEVIPENLAAPSFDRMPGAVLTLNGDLHDRRAIREALEACRACGFSRVLPMPCEETVPCPTEEGYDIAMEYLLQTAEEIGLRVLWYAGPHIRTDAEEAYFRANRNHAAQELFRKTVLCTEGECTRFHLYTGGTTMAVTAVDVDSGKTMDLTAEATAARDGIFCWTAPQGNWELQQYFCRPVSGVPCLNLLSYKACRAWFDLLCAPLRGRLAPYVGRTVIGIIARGISFEGVPGRRMWDPAFHDSLPGNGTLSSAVLYPSLFQMLDPQHARYKYRLYRHLAQLVRAGCFRALGDTAASLGIPASAQLSDAKVTTPTTVFGDALLPFAEHVRPFAEFPHAYAYGMNGMKLTADASVNFGHAHTGAILFRDYHTNHPEAFRREMLHALATGADELYSDVLPLHGRKDAPAGLTPAQWLEDNRIAARIGMLLDGGHPDAEIAMLYPICSLHSQAYFSDTPSPASGQPLPPSDADYLTTLQALRWSCGRTVTLLHPKTLRTECRVEHGSLVMGDDHFRIFVIPGCHVMHIDILEILCRFYDSGGKIIATSALPVYPAEPAEEEDPAVFGELLHHIFGVTADEINPFQLYYENHNAAGGAAFFLPPAQTAADGTNMVSTKLLRELLDHKIDVVPRVILPVMPRVENSSPVNLYMPQFAHMDILEHAGGFFLQHRVRHGDDMTVLLTNTTRLPYDGPVLLRGRYPSIRVWDPADGSSVTLRGTDAIYNGTLCTSFSLYIAPGTARIFRFGSRAETCGKSSDDKNTHKVRYNYMKAIIMAGGKGTRLYDAEHPSPKVLREANGRPLISYVLDTVKHMDPEDVTVLVGFMADSVRARYPELHYAQQGTDAYGTGYAVRCALEQAIDPSYDGDILVLSGDMPLFSEQTIRELCETHIRDGNVCTILSCVAEEPLPYGRVLRRPDTGAIYAIREQKDCTPEEREVRELNCGLYVFRADKLRSALNRIGCDNAAGEYYLTDVPPMLIADGERVGAYSMTRTEEILGVNTPDDLRRVEELLAARA